MKQDINRYEIIEKITPLIENTAMRFGLVPVEIDFVKENHRWFLRIFLYSRERDITLDDCENVTRSIEDFLDELIPVKYNLEVSSPGLDRKLKSPKEYIIFRGHDVIVKLKSLIDETPLKTFEAKLLDYNESFGVKVKLEEKEIIIPTEKIHFIKCLNKKLSIFVNKCILTAPSPYSS